MIKAEHAEVRWDAQKKKWAIRIQIGEEVVKRTPDGNPPRDAADDQLRGMAVEMAHNDGYEIDPAAVTINR